MTAFGSRIRKEIESTRSSSLPPSSALPAAPKNIRGLTRLSAARPAVPIPVNTPSLRKENGGQDATVSLVNRWSKEEKPAVPWARSQAKRWGDEESDEEFPRIGTEEPGMAGRGPPRAPLEVPPVQRESEEYGSSRLRQQQPNQHGDDDNRNRYFHRHSSFENRFEATRQSGVRFLEERTVSGRRYDSTASQLQEGEAIVPGGRWAFAQRATASSHYVERRASEEHHASVGRRIDDNSRSMRYGFDVGGARIDRDKMDRASHASDDQGRFDRRSTFSRRGENTADSHHDRSAGGDQVEPSTQDRRTSRDVSPTDRGEYRGEAGSLQHTHHTGGFTEPRQSGTQERSTIRTTTGRSTALIQKSRPSAETSTPMVLLRNEKMASVSYTAQTSGEESNQNDVTPSDKKEDSMLRKGDMNVPLAGSCSQPVVTAWAPTPPVVAVSLAATIQPPALPTEKIEPCPPPPTAPTVVIKPILSPTPDKTPEELAAEQQQNVLRQVAERRASTTRKLWTDPDKGANETKVEEKSSQKKLLDRNSSEKKMEKSEKKNVEKSDKKTTETKERPNPCRGEGHDHDWKDCPQNPRSENFREPVKEEEKEKVVVERSNPCKIEGHDHDWRVCPNNPHSENFERNNPCKIEGHDHDWNDCPNNPKSKNFRKVARNGRKSDQGKKKNAKKGRRQGNTDSESDKHDAKASEDIEEIESELSSKEKPVDNRKKRSRESRPKEATEVRQKKARSKSERGKNKRHESDERKNSKKETETKPKEAESSEQKSTPSRKQPQTLPVSPVHPVEETTEQSKEKKVSLTKEAKSPVAKPFIPAPTPAVSAWKSGPPPAMKQLSATLAGSVPQVSSPQSSTQATPAPPIVKNQPSVEETSHKLPNLVSPQSSIASIGKAPQPPSSFIINQTESDTTILSSSNTAPLFPGNSALFGDSQGSSAVYGSWNPPPIVLPSTFVDPWKPNPFAPISSGVTTMAGAQFGSIWSTTSLSTVSSTKIEDASAIGLHRSLYVAPSKPVENVTAMSDFSFGNLSINEHDSSEKVRALSNSVSTVTVNDSKKLEEGEILNDAVATVETPSSTHHVYPGKRGGRHGSRKSGGRFNGACPGRGGNFSSKVKSPSSKLTTDSGANPIIEELPVCEDQEAKLVNSGTGNAKQSGRGRGGGRGTKSGRGKPLNGTQRKGPGKKDHTKKKQATPNAEKPLAASVGA